MVNNVIFTKTQHYAEILRHIAAVRKILETDVKKDSSKKAAMLEILKTYNITFILCLREGLNAYEDKEMTCICIDGDVYTCRKQVLLNLISEEEYYKLMRLSKPKAQEVQKTAEELELEIILSENNKSQEKKEMVVEEKKEAATGNITPGTDKESKKEVPSHDLEDKQRDKKAQHVPESKRESKKKTNEATHTAQKPGFIPADIKSYVDKSAERPKPFANKLSMPQDSMICDVYTATVGEVIDKERALDEKHVFGEIVPDRKYVFYVVPFDIPETGTRVGADIMVCMIDCTNNTRKAFVSTSDKKTIVVDIGGKREIWISGDWEDYRFTSDIRFYDKNENGMKMKMDITSKKIRSKNKIEENSGHIVYRFARGKFENGEKRSSVIHVFPIGVENDGNGLTDIALMEEIDVIKDGMLSKKREIEVTGMPSPILLSDESTRVYGFWNGNDEFQIEIN